jgi:very-short-patch-repair endonuclease
MRLYANQPIGTVPRARQLRRDAPEPERRLLRALRESYPQLKWRHQAPVGPYYTDILCIAARLVIEVDGETHATTTEHDATRTRFLQNEGYQVIRFTNADVMANPNGVITQISFSLREKEGAPTAQPWGKDEASTAQEKGGTA